jgi:redox-sensing transcriptional repressor
VYRRSLIELAQEHIPTVSSERLADMAGVNAAKVRKDLSYLGTYGTRGVGYEVQQLLYEIESKLGLTCDSPVVVVGVGNLGQALANYTGFRQRGFPVVALVDVDPTKIGESIAGLIVQSIEELDAIVAEHGVSIGIIATPAASAQSVADRLVAAGVRSILNFAPSVLNVPPQMPVRKVDLATELQILSFYQEHPAESGRPQPAA